MFYFIFHSAYIISNKINIPTYHIILGGEDVNINDIKVWNEYNNRNVIYSYSKEGNDRRVVLAKKHLEQNLIIQDFLNNYEL